MRATQSRLRTGLALRMTENTNRHHSHLDEITQCASRELVCSYQEEFLVFGEEECAFPGWKMQAIYTGEQKRKET